MNISCSVEFPLITSQLASPDDTLHNDLSRAKCHIPVCAWHYNIRLFKCDLLHNTHTHTHTHTDGGYVWTHIPIMPWENRNRHYDVNSCYLEGFSEDGVRICSCCRCHEELCNVKGQRSPNHPEPDHRAVLCSETVFDEPTKRVFQGEKSLRWNICTLRE